MMIVNDEQCYSPLSQSADEYDTLDDLLSTPSSECHDTSTLSDAGRPLVEDTDAAGDAYALTGKRKIRPNGGKLLIRNSREATGSSKTKHPGSVGRRNERERNRVKQVNLGFDRLRQYVRLPGLVSAKKKLSKVDTLRAAVDYITHLKCMLTLADNDTPTTVPDAAVDDVEEKAAGHVEFASQLMDTVTDRVQYADPDGVDCRQVEFLKQEQTVQDQLLSYVEHSPQSQNLHQQQQQTMYLNVEGLSEASIQLLMRHSPHQFPQQQQQQLSVTNHIGQQRASASHTFGSFDGVFPAASNGQTQCGNAEIVEPIVPVQTTESSINDLFFDDDIDEFQLTHFSTDGMMLKQPVTEIIGLPPPSSPSTSGAFQIHGSMPTVDYNANYYGQFQTSMVASTPMWLATSGLMTVPSLTSEDCEIAVDRYGDDKRRLAELKAWLMTDC